MYENMKIEELKNHPLTFSYHFTFKLSIDDISYFLLINKSGHTGVKFLFAHNEDHCHYCKGSVKKGNFRFNLFTYEVYRDIVEYMLSSSTLRVKLLTTYHDLYEGLKEELAFIHELEEEYQ